MKKINGVKRNPLNLCIILDKSKSMNGAKLQQAKKSSKMIINSLADEDIISFVTNSFSKSSRSISNERVKELRTMKPKESAGYTEDELSNLL